MQESLNLPPFPSVLQFSFPMPPSSLYGSSLMSDRLAILQPALLSLALFSMLDRHGSSDVLSGTSFPDRLPRLPLQCTSRTDADTCLGHPLSVGSCTRPRDHHRCVPSTPRHPTVFRLDRSQRNVFHCAECPVHHPMHPRYGRRIQITLLLDTYLETRKDLGTC